MGYILRMINPVQRVARRYYVEFGISMAAYVAGIMGSRMLLHGPMRHAEPGWQVAIAVVPVVPVVFVLAAVVRLVRSTDELCRQILVDSLAIAGGATALIAVTYGLIEGERFGHLSAWWTYTTFMVAWGIATIFVRRRYQ
jgi:hypothetical protein